MELNPGLMHLKLWIFGNTSSLQVSHPASVLQRPFWATKAHWISATLESSGVLSCQNRANLRPNDGGDSKMGPGHHASFLSSPVLRATGYGELIKCVLKCGCSQGIFLLCPLKGWQQKQVVYESRAPYVVPITLMGLLSGSEVHLQPCQPSQARSADCSLITAFTLLWPLPFLLHLLLVTFLFSLVNFSAPFPPSQLLCFLTALAYHQLHHVPSGTPIFYCC